jgi:isoquinoline 1-oxidoreductase subunit beta
MEKPAHIDRRSFIKVGALLGGGLLISMATPLNSFLGKTSAKVFSPNAFLQIGEDNTIVVILSKVEIGQGIWTTLPMLLAEELDCDWSKITVRHSPPGSAADFLAPAIEKSTGGSETTTSQFDIYRQAGATARVMLVQAAAKRMGVQPAACKTANGFVIAGGKKVSFGEVAADASALPQPVVVLREPKDWKYIGRPQKRLDAPDMVNGRTKYGIDTQFPGFLTALVAHAPVFGGKVKSLDASLANKIEGVVDIVQIPSGVAVLAENFWAAKMGREALKIEWENGENENIDSTTLLDQYSTLAKTTGSTVLQRGDVAIALNEATTSLNVEFSFPYLAHAPMEPLNCTVKITADKCEVWAGTQSPLLHQAEVAAYLGFKPEQVLFYTPHIGGSFGRRGSFSSDWIMEAVHIAKISGKSIKLVWTREDDIRGGYYRPMYVHRVQIGIGRDGIPTAWKHCIVGQSLFTNTPLDKYIVQNGIDYSSVTTGAPYSGAIPNYSFQLITTNVGVPVLAWRSVGNSHTAFVMETLIDELATLAKIDPIDYRRIFFKDSPRHLPALNLAAEKFGWKKPLPKGRFKGVALHEAMGSYVSQVVEISIDRDTLVIHRVVCAIDCGLAVNPDGVRAQMEGGIVFGLTAALYGEITIENGQVKQSNFHDYQMLRMNRMPDIEVYIVPSTEKMGGAGEPGVPPVAPALANALFAATGKRIRRLPFQQADFT